MAIWCCGAARSGTNYHPEAVEAAAALLAKEGLPARLMVDCSHGNSNKDYRRQGEVLQQVAEQVGRAPFT